MKTLKKFSLLVILVHSLSLFRPKNTKIGGYGKIDKGIFIFICFIIIKNK